MGGSKLPGLQVNSPKGTGKKTGKKTDEQEVVEKTGGAQGEKRIVTDHGDPDPDTTEHGSFKRRRMRSPDKRKQILQWKKRQTFFTGQGEEEGTEQKPDLEPDKETKDLMKHEDLSDRTTVKNKIQLINKRSSG